MPRHGRPCQQARAFLPSESALNLHVAVSATPCEGSFQPAASDSGCSCCAATACERHFQASCACEKRRNGTVRSANILQSQTGRVWSQQEALTYDTGHEDLKRLPAVVRLWKLGGTRLKLKTLPCRLQQDALTDQHSFLDDLCSVADAVPLAPLLQGGAADDDAAAAGRAHAMAAQQAQMALLLTKVAQVPSPHPAIRQPSQHQGAGTGPPSPTTYLLRAGQITCLKRGLRQKLGSSFAMLHMRRCPLLLCGQSSRCHIAQS